MAGVLKYKEQAVQAKQPLHASQSIDELQQQTS